MPSPLDESVAHAPAARRPARDLIEAVVENMRNNLELLKYSTLAPSRYTVYLHPAEYARLEGILPILREQTTRALAEEMQRLNKSSAVRRWTKKWRQSTVEVRSAGADWHVDFIADPDGDLKEGDVLVDSELLLPARPDLGVGERTRRITTVHSGHRTTVRDQTLNPAGAQHPSVVLAQITYDDDSGHHSYDLSKDSLSVGRGGSAHPVDIRIAASADVSREHARVRRDPATGRFFLIDLSSLGTTLNGRHVPRGYDEVDGAKRENGHETPLPDSARIGLADTVFLEFRKVR